MSSRGLIVFKNSRPYGHTMRGKHVLWKVYTDASINMKQKNVGIGIVHMYKADVVGVNYFRLKTLQAQHKLDINYAEMAAMLCAVREAPKMLPLCIYTDSQCSMTFLEKCNQDRVINKKYLTIVHDLLCCFRDRQHTTYVKKVKAHSNVYGNVLADACAKMGTRCNKSITL